MVERNQEGPRVEADVCEMDLTKRAFNCLQSVGVVQKLVFVKRCSL